MFGQFAERMAAGADATAVTSRQTLVTRIFSFNARSAASNGASTHLYRRHMSGGAIAGTVVGVVVAATLLLFCLYPVVVGYFKRRSKSRKRHDAETAVGGGEGATAAAAAGQQRASSSESEKNGDLERGNFDDKQADPAAEAIQRYDSNLVTANFVAKFGEEYMPQDMEDNQPGVLQGTSADYYRTSIPSEAFGMVDRPEQEQDDLSKSPTPSRASSFGHNFRSMFRRTNSKEHDVEEMAMAAQQRSLKKEDTLTESPIENTYPTPPAAPIAPLTRAMIISPMPATEASPPQSPPDSERRLRQSASPPFHPAPGTVNPMDIMPASTQSEHWHRTEHQLFSTSHESPPPMGELMDQMPTSPPAQPLPEAEPSTFSPPAEDISWLEPDDTVYEQIVNEGLEKHYLSADGAGLSDPQNGLSPDWMSPPPAAASTDISSSLTPLSQPEVTSPESIAASNGRPSASPLALPQHAGSPEALGNFQCTQPGCTQSFDQKHKLKYVALLQSLSAWPLTNLAGITSDITPRTTSARTLVVIWALAPKLISSVTSTIATRRRRSSIAPWKAVTIPAWEERPSLARITGSDT